MRIAVQSISFITTHFGENLNFLLIKLTFIETVFHILNRKLPQGREVWPLGSHDINPFDYFKCGISRRGINRSFHKKTVPDHHHQGGLQQHPQKAISSAKCTVKSRYK
jgi:hypothetical protein